jgi:hypothetical protein
VSFIGCAELEQEDELSAAREILSLLVTSSVDEVPSEQEDNIGLCFEKRLHRADRKALAGHVLAVLVHVAIHDEVYNVASDTNRVDQGGAIGRSPIASDRGSFGLRRCMSAKRSRISTLVEK